MRCLSNSPNKQVAQGSNGGCGELATVAEAFAVELDCDRLIVEVEDFELSARNANNVSFLYKKNRLKWTPHHLLDRPATLHWTSRLSTAGQCN